MELYQIKMRLYSKGKIIRIMRQPMEWEKIFASYSSNKGLISTIYKELKKLNTIWALVAHAYNSSYLRG
jgi:hypothetical protein